MKSIVLLTVFVVIFLVISPQMVLSQDSLKSIYFNPCLELSVGYHNIGSHDLHDIGNAGYGKIDQADFCFLAGAGMSLFIPKIAEISCLFHFTFNALQYGYKWTIVDEPVPLTMEIFDIRLELKSLLPALGRMSPYLGIGTTIDYDLLDEEGDGFTKGGGNFHYVFGVDINLDKKLLGGNRTLGKGMTGDIRVGVVYRPSFAFEEFKLGRNTAPIEVSGNSLTYVLGFRFGLGLF